MGEKIINMVNSWEFCNKLFSFINKQLNSSKSQWIIINILSHGNELNIIEIVGFSNYVVKKRLG